MLLSCSTYNNPVVSEACWVSHFPAFKEKSCHLWIPHAGGAQITSLCSEACLECICCPRTPTVPICSPALLSSSIAASCVVTTLSFILSPAVPPPAPLDVHFFSCFLVSTSKHPHPSSRLPVSSAGERKGKLLSLLKRNATDRFNFDDGGVR